MNGWKIGFIAFLAAALIALTGCSSGKPAKDAMISALSHMQNVKSMAFDGHIAINDIAIPPGMNGDNGAVALTGGFIGLLKGADIQLHGAIRSDPQQAEFTVDAALGGPDLKFNLSLPVIATPDKLWIKIPTVPGVALPDGIVGKFMEIDAQKPAAEQGTGAAMPDMAAMQQLGQDILKTAFENFDEKTYFSEPEASEVQHLPEGYKADQFVRFTVDPEQSGQALTAAMHDVAPKIIDLLLGNEAYMDALHLKKEDLEKAKSELAGNGTGNAVKINELTMIGGIQDDYLTFQQLNINMEFAKGEEVAKLDADMTMHYTDINKDVKFEYDLPKDAIPADQVMEMLGLSGKSDTASTGG